MKVRNLGFLKHSFTVADYCAWAELCEKNSVMASALPNDDFFRKKLHLTPVARCPFCNCEFLAKVDLFTIKNWYLERTPISKFYVYPFRYPFPLETDCYRVCEHLAIVDSFLNFNGVLPDLERPEGKMWGYKLGPEVPGVMYQYFEQKLGLKAVMQAVPVCRIRGDDFQPVHQAYFITYYLPERNPSIDLATLPDGRNPPYPENSLHKKLFLDFPARLLGDNYFGDRFLKIDTNLKPYVEQGDLYWMEEGFPEFIHTSDWDSFPFKNISGSHEGYNLKKWDSTGMNSGLKIERNYPRD